MGLGNSYEEMWYAYAGTELKSTGVEVTKESVKCRGINTPAMRIYKSNSRRHAGKHGVLKVHVNYKTKAVKESIKWKIDNLFSHQNGLLKSSLHTRFQFE